MSSLPATPPSSAPIVVADTGAAFEVLRQSLGGGVVLVAAHTLQQAKALVTADTPLVLCDCHFDEGRMYELLRYMKARPALSRVPFLAIRVSEGELEDAMYESVKIATKALGADGFIDLFRWQVRHGEAEAAHRLTRSIELLASGGRLPDTTT